MDEYEFVDCQYSGDMCYMENNKKYINRLRSFAGIDQEVILWVEREILSVERRIHKYGDEALAAYIVLGYKALEKECSMDYILEQTKTTKLKKKILDLTSGESTKNTPIHNVRLGIPIQIGSPVDYINIIVNKFLENRGIRLKDKIEELCLSIEFFAYTICESSRIISNYEPRSAACAIVFFYLSNFTDISSIKGKKTGIKKTHFKTLSFNDEGTIDINPKDFDTCCLKLERYYQRFEELASEEDVLFLINYQK